MCLSGDVIYLCVNIRQIKRYYCVLFVWCCVYLSSVVYICLTRSIIYQKNILSVDASQFWVPGNHSSSVVWRCVCLWMCFTFLLFFLGERNASGRDWRKWVWDCCCVCAWVSACNSKWWMRVLPSQRPSFGHLLLSHMNSLCSAVSSSYPIPKSLYGCGRICFPERTVVGDSFFESLVSSPQGNRISYRLSF